MMKIFDQDTTVEITKKNRLGSSQMIAGVRYMGLVPIGSYKVTDPVGGRASRIKSNTTSLIPIDQPHNAGHDGSFYTVGTFSLASHFQRKNENG
jgi:hypothetical protein|tara:strand:- start:231 stop:512 length:282 start_codon:yes stop_codon:yes gene_type:complete